MNEVKAKFLQIKQGTIRQEHEKRVSAYAHMRRDTALLLQEALHIFDDPSSIPAAPHVLIGFPILKQKTNKNIPISYSLKYKL